MIYLTSDEHYYHKNIIKYCNRPFKNVNEMNEKLISNHNEVVENDDDYVYHLGDFALCSNIKQIEEILNKLNGIHILILGNHDKFKPFDYVEAGFQSVHTSFTLKHDFFDTLYFNHDPVVFQNKEFSCCGHVHGLFKKLHNTINVGVDVWDFKPVDIKIIYYDECDEKD